MKCIHCEAYQEMLERGCPNPVKDPRCTCHLFKQENELGNSNARPTGTAFTEQAIEILRKVAHQQDGKGFEKYGKGLDPLDHQYNWLAMALEEKADDLKYMIAHMVKQDVVLNEVYKLLENMIFEDHWEVRSAIHEQIKSKLTALYGTGNGTGA